MDLVDNGRNLMDQWFIDMVMNSSNDKIGGSSSSMAGELGFQSEANGGGLINGGGNLMMEIGNLGGRGTIAAEGDGEENNLLSDWNFGGTGSGMSEIEKLVNNINGGVDETASPMDLTNQRGDFGIGGDGGSGRDHMSLYSSKGGGGGIGGNDDAEMMLHGLFGSGSSNENENENENGKEDHEVEEEVEDEEEDDLLSKEWPNNLTP